jgi:peroxiredoxin Q/BCP
VNRDVDVPSQKVDRRLGIMNVGDLVDDFSALDQHGDEVTLASLVESGPVVLFFYPKAMTPG